MPSSGSCRIPYEGAVQRDGVPLVPHSIAFSSAMMSLQVLMGIPHETEIIGAHGHPWRADADYYRALGLSGEAFLFLFDAAEYFRFGHVDGGEPVRACFAYAGIPVRLLARQRLRGVDGTWSTPGELVSHVSHVSRTLAAGYPALILGRTAVDRALLAIGYEDGGQTLVAWTFAPGCDITNKTFAPQDCQYVRNWMQGVDAVALVSGPPREPTDRSALLLQALHRAERLLRAETCHPYGERANYYEEWTRRLLAAPPVPALAEIEHISPEIWDLAERRLYAASFLRIAREALDAHAMGVAIHAFEEIHDIMWHISALVDESAEERVLGDARLRRSIVELIQYVRGLDARAAASIVNFLASASQ